MYLNVLNNNNCRSRTIHGLVSRAGYVTHTAIYNTPVVDNKNTHAAQLCQLSHHQRDADDPHEYEVQCHPLYQLFYDS